MDKEKLFDALSGLSAYDQGCTDSGIHDNRLKQEVKDFLIEEYKKKENKYRIYPKILDEFCYECFMCPEAREKGAGLEDVKNFLEWMAESLGFE